MYNLNEEMLIRVQPNRWSCVPAAFATVLDMDLDTLLESIGHDGSEVIFPDLEEPLCYRGFNLQEMALVLYNMGYLVGYLDVEPLSIVDEQHIFSLTFPDSNKMFAKIMGNSVGVGCGRIKGTEKTHAFAWNGQQCYDPTGFIYPLSHYELYTYCPLIDLTLLELKPSRVESKR